MNKIIFLGRISKDVELKTTTNNKEVAKFSIAVPRQFKKEGFPDCDFFNCVAWGKTATFVSNYFTKGKQICVEGNMQNRSWDDADGNKRYITELIVQNVYFAGSKNDSQGDAQEVSKKEEGGFYPVSEDDDELPF